MLVAQLAEWSLLTPDDTGSNLYICFLFAACLQLRRSEFELPRSLQFLKMAIPCIFLSSFSSFRTAIYGHYNFFADNWIRTADLWYQKQPR